MLLLQEWEHAALAWSELSQDQPEHAMGRTEPDSVELADRLG